MKYVNGGVGEEWVLAAVGVVVVVDGEGKEGKGRRKVGR